MSAIQLLRILQTIQSDVKNETCSYVSAAQDLIMKENQNETMHYDSESFGRDSNPLVVGSKEMCQLNGLRMDAHPPLLEAKGTDKCWKPKTEDGFSIDNRSRTMDSTTGHDPAVAGGEFIHYNENDSGDVRLPCAAASDLFEREKDLFADKNVLEYDHPELIVCYKEINYHVVKDICIDDGIPASRKILSDSSKDNQSEYGFSQALNDNCNPNANGADTEEILISSGVEATPLQNTEFSITNQQRSKNVSNGVKLVTQGLPKLPSESSLETSTRCNLEESVQKDATNSGAATKISDKESFIDSALPIQEFGTRSFLRSFLNSLDDEGKVNQLPDQFSSAKVASKEAEPKEDVQEESILRYNSEVETRSITFNFNSLPPVVGGKTELIEEVIDQKDAEPDILSESRQVQSSSKNTIAGEIPNNDAVVSLRRYDQGESSFSADSFSHSGPIPFSGSISLRSEGSGTSGRSFAFPVLQAEWSSSPVRMTKADGRRFRKHKCWRSGLLCCRF